MVGSGSAEHVGERHLGAHHLHVAALGELDHHAAPGEGQGLELGVRVWQGLGLGVRVWQGLGLGVRVRGQGSRDKG